MDTEHPFTKLEKFLIWTTVLCAAGIIYFIIRLVGRMYGIPD